MAVKKAKARERAAVFVCLKMCVCAGLYEEDNQWMTQINRLQKLIDRLEKKATGYTHDLSL